MRKAFTIFILFIIVFFSDVIAQEKTQNNEILSSENGRFIFGQIPEYRRDQYMLDTKTGRLWHIVVNKEEVKSLEPILYT